MFHLRKLVFACALGIVAAATGSVSAQEAAPARRLKPRRLAPGVLTVIPPSKDQGETFSGPRPFVEVTQGFDAGLLGWKPQLYPETQTLKAKAQAMTFRRSVWYLEFAFKPLRMIYVDIPQPTGRMQRKPVWYLVYRIKNNGYHLRPSKGRFEVSGTPGKKDAAWLKEPDEFGHLTWGFERVNHTVRFFPRIELVAHEVGKRYMDQLIPVAVPAIQRREDPAIKLHDSISISSLDIPLSDDRTDRSVWGVMTWTDLDPDIDFFSIYIQGLTNAHRFEDAEGALRTGSPPLTGRRFEVKTLQLNFWRPGDAVFAHENELRFGMPHETTRFVRRESWEAKSFAELYGVPEPMDYRWFYQ